MMLLPFLLLSLLLCLLLPYQQTMTANAQNTYVAQPLPGNWWDVNDDLNEQCACVPPAKMYACHGRDLFCWGYE